mgnify:CR=1 FL=1
MKTRWAVIGRGFNGWHAAAPNVTSSGGHLDDYLWRGEPTTGYASEAAEGALVYDAEACEADEAGRNAYIDLVLRGPMLDCALPPDGVSKFSLEGRQAARRMLDGLQGAFATYATLAQDEKFTGLDYVGLGIYEALLRRVPGIKIGRVRGGKVIWE